MNTFNSDLGCVTIDEVIDPFQDGRWKLELKGLRTESIVPNRIKDLLDIHVS